jgi:enoyl-CoA hydratase
MSEGAPAGYRTIELLADGALATIRLNRPERMNAVVEEMYTEIRNALERVGADPEVRCLILTGTVLRRGGVEKQAFCAGADLKKHSAGERDAHERRRYIELAHNATRSLYDFSKPVIAAVNGPARGAGTEMALCCDFLLMAEEATLALPETGLGTFVGGGITHLLPRLIGIARAKELVYTGRVIDGRTAVELGLARACYPVAQLNDEARALGRAIAERAPISIALAKRLLQRAPGLEYAAALDHETEAILRCMESEDWKEGIRAFVEKRKAEFLGR